MFGLRSRRSTKSCLPGLRKTTPAPTCSTAKHDLHRKRRECHVLESERATPQYHRRARPSGRRADRPSLARRSDRSPALQPASRLSQGPFMTRGSFDSALCYLLAGWLRATASKDGIYACSTSPLSLNTIELSSSPPLKSFVRPRDLQGPIHARKGVNMGKEKPVMEGW